MWMVCDSLPVTQSPLWFMSGRCWKSKKYYVKCDWVHLVFWPRGLSILCAGMYAKTNVVACYVLFCLKLPVQTLSLSLCFKWLWRSLWFGFGSFNSNVFYDILRGISYSLIEKTWTWKKAREQVSLQSAGDTFYQKLLITAAQNDLHGDTLPVVLVAWRRLCSMQSTLKVATLCDKQ